MMARLSSSIVVCLALALGGGLWAGQHTGKVKTISGKELEKYIPASVLLDGENAPVQKRNTVGARMEDGKLLLVALIDTSGFSSDYQQKYVGVVVAQGKLRIGESKLKPGFYGLGRKKATEGDMEAETFLLYDMGGNLVAETPAMKHEGMRPATPIQLKTDQRGEAQLYLGLYFVKLSAG